MRLAVLVALALVIRVGVTGAEPAVPGFRVTLLDGKGELDSRDLIGKKILVLRFQTSYCKPCARESAALSRVAERFRARGVEVVAIHVQDAPADVRKFIRANRATASRARPTR
jgi:peroxiredoxin